MLKPRRHTDLDIKVHIGNMLINIIYINFEPPVASWGYPNHCHSSYELHFIPSGTGVLEVSQQEFRIEPGTFYLTGPGVYHKQLADRTDPMCEYCINFEIKVRRRKNVKGDTYLPGETDAILQVLQNTSFWFGKDEFATIALFDSIMKEFQNQWLGYYTNVQSLVSQIIVNAVRSFTHHRESGYHIPKKILNDSRRYLADSYFEVPRPDMTPQILADRIGISIRQLERLMISYYGKTFSEKLLDARLEKAKDLLLSTALPVQDIAEQVGFRSASYFGKVFKRAEAATPQQYRQNNHHR
ncbi:MAG: hypothetical protein K0R57_1211 [Paenibacillaceae bacterium]|jgi:AraC-like DNA-binding protein|nr:hypothetical protein [Paenibacillaceae bacterium]